MASPKSGLVSGSSTPPRSTRSPLEVGRSSDIDLWGLETDLYQPSASHHRHVSLKDPVSEPASRASPLRRRRPRTAGEERQGSMDSTEGWEDEFSHPLNEALVDAGDSRPRLKRLTSETERQVAESSRSGPPSEGSTRGSFDMLRMTEANGDDAGLEVEVFIHQVKATESLQGIALLYGIDVATLRKANKMWPSDPVHLRTHLYVPLEACRWNQASEMFTRGPGEGQVTLTPKPHHLKRATFGDRQEDQAPDLKGKGKTRMVGERGGVESLIDLEKQGPNGHVEILNSPLTGDDGFDPVGSFMPSTNASYTRPSVETIRPSLDSVDTVEEVAPPRVLDIVRIPNSQLRFFPRRREAERSARPSLEQDIQRRSIERDVREFEAFFQHPKDVRRATSLSSKSAGPSIHHDLHTLPKPLRPHTKPPDTKSKMVKLRPPNMPIRAVTSPHTLADRLSALFTVPPPPNHYAPIGSGKSRKSEDSVGVQEGSRRSSVVSTPVPSKPVETLEMDTRRSFDTSRHLRSVSNGARIDSKKLR